MYLPSRSPRITKLSWGHLETEDGTFQDAWLYPGGAHPLDLLKTTNGNPEGDAVAFQSVS